MFLGMRFVVVLVCVGVGITPYCSGREDTPERVARVLDDALFLMDKGELHKAELILRQALTQFPQDKELKQLFARCLILQEKVMEGLRCLKSIYSETEALKEIAAIYREQGNRDMLAAVEQKWGVKMAESPRSEPLHVASTLVPVLPGKEAVLIPSQVSATPPVLVPVVSLTRRTAVVSEGSVVPPFGSETFENDVSIPLPNSASPLSLATSFPKPALVPKSPHPLPEAFSSWEKLTLVNPAKLPGLPEVIPSTERYPPRPAVAPRPPIYSSDTLSRNL